MSMGALSEQARWPAPTGHGQRILVPSLRQLQDLLKQQQTGSPGASWQGDNTVLPLPSDLAFCGSSFSDLRSSAIQSAVKLAYRYTSSYLPVELPQVGERTPIIMGGHQPELFHCGVWFKNFVLSKLAREAHGVAIHFLVDNDVCRATNIRVPARTAEGWRTTEFPYDVGNPSQPWENCRLKDRVTWESFAQRVLAELPPMPHTPLIERLWKHAILRSRHSDSLGLLLSQARHLLESELGLETLEVPLSTLVGTIEFAKFSMQLLSDAPRLHAIYNAEIQSYRAAHRIRNHAQPVPQLSSENGWLEVPWWCYRNDATERQALWVYSKGQQLTLSDRNNWQITIENPATPEAAAKWQSILLSGMRLRPRALLTTMYARLFLCNLFLHGLGGARYDQLTDKIIGQYFAVQPPPVAVASATLHLPLDAQTNQSTGDVDQQLAQWQQNLRAAQNNPEAVLNYARVENQAERSLWDQLLVEKRALLSTIPPKGEKWQWHSSIKDVNQRLAELSKPHLVQIQSRIDDLQRLQTQQSIRFSRDYSFCLFPVQTIQECFAEF